jgi:mono/diheme cytochrome c family protein
MHSAGLKRWAIFVIFLAIPLSILMIRPQLLEPRDSAAAEIGAHDESAARVPNWLVAPALESAALSARGRRLFLRDCSRCHGRFGDGVSPIADTLHPRPFDLTRFEFTHSFVLRTLRDGVPGTDMPAWHSSPENDLRTVAAYTTRLGRSDALPPEDSYAPPEVLHEGGRRVYTMHCAPCHGENGTGDGPDAAQHLPSPANFAEMRPSYAAAKQIIENGVPGTAMAAWPLLTPAEIQAVTFYIRTFYASPAPASGANQ